MILIVLSVILEVIVSLKAPSYHLYTPSPLFDETSKTFFCLFTFRHRFCISKAYRLRWPGKSHKNIVNLLLSWDTKSNNSLCEFQKKDVPSCNQLTWKYHMCDYYRSDEKNLMISFLCGLVLWPNRLHCFSFLNPPHDGIFMMDLCEVINWMSISAK